MRHFVKFFVLMIFIGPPGLQPCHNPRQRLIPSRFSPHATTSEHRGINWMEINIPTCTSKFSLNVSASLYKIGCGEMETEIDFFNLPTNYSQTRNEFDACQKVPTSETCRNSYELVACFKSKRPPLVLNKAISQICKRHFSNEPNSAGFRIRHCVRRDARAQLIIIQSILDFSFTFLKYKVCRKFSFKMEDLLQAHLFVPIFFIDFSSDRASTIRGAGKELTINLAKKKNSLSSVLNSIMEESWNGTLAKSLHFIPPENGYIENFFQVSELHYSKLITREEDLEPYRNNPNITSPSRCDILGNDCEPVRDLLRKAEALVRCCSPCVCRHPSELEHVQIPSGDPLKAGDTLFSKMDAQEMYDQRKEACEKCFGTIRQKRQASPSIQGARKWTKFPISIKFSEKLKNIDQYKEAIISGINLISAESCITFKFDNKSKEGIVIIDDGGTWSFVGRRGGWQKMSLNITEIGTVGHELLHALGFNHEHMRDDAYRYVKFYAASKNDDWKNNYEPMKKTENFQLPYDFGSIMHYSTDLDEQTMIIPFNRFYQRTAGQRKKLSFKDTLLLNKIYCQDACKQLPNKCQNGGYQNPKKCSRCLCPDGYRGTYCQFFIRDTNCRDVADFPTELTADWQPQVLRPKIRCAGNPPCTCHWRITPIDGQKLVVKMLRLEAAAFECERPCGKLNVEFKFRKDKRSNGALLCCASDIEKGNTNWLETDTADEEMLISARIANKMPTEIFALSYETGGGAEFEASSGCAQRVNWRPERNPHSTFWCHNFETGERVPCLCPDGADCPRQQIASARYHCDVLIINGQFREIRGQNESKWFNFECLKRKGQNEEASPPFWAYRRHNGKTGGGGLGGDGTTGGGRGGGDDGTSVQHQQQFPLHIDDLLCLQYGEVGIDKVPDKTVVDYPLMQRRLTFTGRHNGDGGRRRWEP